MYIVTHTQTQLLHSGRTSSIGFMVNVNTLKKQAAGFFRSLTNSRRINSVIFHIKQTEESADRDFVMKESSDKCTTSFGDRPQLIKGKMFTFKGPDK